MVAAPLLRGSVDVDYRVRDPLFAGQLVLGVIFGLWGIALAMGEANLLGGLTGARTALRHRDQLLGQVGRIREQRDRIVTRLEQLGLEPAASDSNFVFFGGLSDAQGLWEDLLGDGVLIRDVGIPGHLRVTAGTEEETTAFLDSLERHLPDRR